MYFRIFNTSHVSVQSLLDEKYIGHSFFAKVHCLNDTSFHISSLDLLLNWLFLFLFNFEG